MSDLPPCHPSIVRAPAFIMVDTGATGGAAIFEDWVKEFAAETGTATDWHYMGGRAVVRTLNDVDDVRDAFIERWKSETPTDPEGAPMRILQAFGAVT